MIVLSYLITKMETGTNALSMQTNGDIGLLSNVKVVINTTIIFRKTEPTEIYLAQLKFTSK